jgi:hypothetical protein
MFWEVQKMTALNPKTKDHLLNFFLSSLPSELAVRHIHKIARSNYQLCHVRLSVCLSVHLSIWNTSAPTGWIFMKFGIWVFFGYLSRKFNVHENLRRVTGALHKHVYTFMKTSHWILLKMRNVSDKSCRENQNTHFTFCNSLPNIMPFMR